jgi:hypothetical protein
MSSADQQTAAAFAAAISRHDFRTAADIITNVTNAGERELAALLLEGVISAGVEAVERMAASRTVSVTQAFTEVPKGATVIGYSSRRTH